MRSPLHNIGGWIALRTASAAERIALVDDERTLTYAQLEDRCARAAGWLAAGGVRRGDRVALLLGNRAATLELVLAAARLGAIAVPLNTRLAPPEIAQLLGDCTPRVLCYEAELEAVANTALSQLPAVPATQLSVGGSPDAYESALERATPHREVAAVATDDPVILMYTSGTTGVPKGALLPHRKTLYNSLNAQLFFELTEADRVLVPVPLFHSFGLKILSLPALYAGARVVLRRHFDAEAIWETVGEQRISYLGGVPTMFRALLDAFDAAPGRLDLYSLRFMFTAGAAIPVEIVRAFEARGLLLKQGFGQTETSILCCLDAKDAIRKAGTVGRPVFHTELRIVRADTLEGPVDGWKHCAAEETGEIVVRGPITMLGYWNRPEATAEVLREDGWLRTGDLAAADAEGFVTLTGRARDMYISGGENVYPAQVEAVYHEHPAIRDIAVVGVPDARWGETGAAHVVLEDGAALDPEALLAWGRERLATFKLPKRWVAADTLPRTASGKVQKFALETPASKL